MKARSSLPRVSASASTGEYSLLTAHIDMGQLVAQDMHGLGQPIHFLAGEKAEGKARLLRVRCAPRGLASRLDLRQHQPRVIEKRLPGRGQLDAMHAARQ